MSLLVKSVLNPLIETMATNAFGVDQYADIFERLAFARRNRPALRRIFRRRLGDDIAASQLLFIHVPKNGGTSVKRALYRSDPGHASVRYYDLFFPEWFATTASLAILRDPVDRFLSGLDFLRGGGGGDVRIQAKPLRRLSHIHDADALLDHLATIHEGGDWLAADTFLRPQGWYVTDIAGLIRVRHFWLLEQANQGLADFLRGWGVAGLQHANRTRRRDHDLSETQVARVHQIYATDCALYGAVKAAGGYSDALIGQPVDALVCSRPF
jgi:hypothetical protein